VTDLVLDHVDRDPLVAGWRRGIVVATWVTAVGLLLALASQQVQPGTEDQLAASATLLVASLVTAIVVPRPTLAAAAPWAAPLVLGLVLLGRWNPLNLATVTLVLDHAFLGIAAAAALVATCVRPGTRRWSRLGAIVATATLSLLITASLAIGSLWSASELLVGVTRQTSTDSSQVHGDVRLDLQRSGDCGVVTYVVRSGNGLMLRQGPRSDVCEREERWTLVSDHLLVITCADSVEGTALARYLAIDPASLAVVGETVVGSCP
jgi:hypothetical protein